jgi:hypothetical protein
MIYQSAEIAFCDAGVERIHHTPVTALAVSFDNVLNVQFSNERACVRICSSSSAASVARWPMTDAHEVRVNVSPMMARCSGVSVKCREIVATSRILPSGGDSLSSPGIHSPSNVSANTLGI